MHLHKRCIIVNNIIWVGGGGEGGKYREANKDKLMGENLLFSDSLFTCFHL